MTGARDWPCDESRPIGIPRESGFKLDGDGPSWLVAGDVLVLLRCACGVILGSPTRHSIAADGTVKASIVCSERSMGREPCGWHVYGRLLGWPGVALAAGAPKVLPRAASGDVPSLACSATEQPVGTTEGRIDMDDKARQPGETDEAYSKRVGNPLKRAEGETDAHYNARVLSGEKQADFDKRSSPHGGAKAKKD